MIDETCAQQTADSYHTFESNLLPALQSFRGGGGGGSGWTTCDSSTGRDVSDRCRLGVTTPCCGTYETPSLSVQPQRLTLRGVNSPDLQTSNDCHCAKTAAVQSDAGDALGCHGFRCCVAIAPRDSNNPHQTSSAADANHAGLM